MALFDQESPLAVNDFVRWPLCVEAGRLPLLGARSVPGR